MKFRSENAHLVNLCIFMRVLRLNDRKDAEPAFDAFKNSKERVEWLSVIAIMILMSNQKFISKVTFLFSLADFNGNREVNCAELCIGLRYLMLGISHAFPHIKVPPKNEVEKDTIEVFSKIDGDKSAYVTLEEIVSFAYMSTPLRRFFAPFPAEDQRIFEELIIFNQESGCQRHESVKRLGEQEKKMINSLRLTPDVAQKKQGRRSEMRAKRERPWCENTMVTKPFSFLVYRLFAHLIDESANWISNETLLNLTHSNKVLKEIVDGAVKHSAEQGVEDPGHPLRTVASSLESRITGAEFARSVQHHGDHISLRALFCLLCPGVKEAEIQDGMKWCHGYRAHDVLEELLKHKTGAMSLDRDSSFDDRPDEERVHIEVDEEDIDALLEAIDLDKNGNISLEDLVKGGNLQPEEARRLVRLWDREKTGELSKGDLLAIVHEMHSSVRQNMKALFANSKLP